MSKRSEHVQAEHLNDDPWQALKQFTDARIALGHAGVSLPTKPLLEFQLAHAQARDAVHTAMDSQRIAAHFHSYNSHIVCSAANNRSTYLQRPDLGRVLNDESRQRLQSPANSAHTASDLTIVIADGLSATAMNRNAIPFTDALLNQLQNELPQINIGAVIIAEQARVALGDDIASLLNSRAVVVLIGERPGLSSPDSLGIYFTQNPQPGLTDERRNCISNVREAGLSYDDAARRLLYLLNEGQRLGTSGVSLKDRSDDQPLEVSQQEQPFLLR